MAFTQKTRNYMIEDLGRGQFRYVEHDGPAVGHIRVYSNTTRPLATVFPPGFQIWNSSDNAPNFVDSAGNWRDAAGVIT
jgi:hypothetical protein